jgi:hypothetical protein
VGFTKGVERNWGVPWHQDRVIALRDRKEVAGYGNWSRKADVWHCEPPLDLLHRMTFLRVFLDPVGPENGGVEFALGSHREGGSVTVSPPMWPRAIRLRLRLPSRAT